MKPIKVLVTGCLGLIGNHFSRYLLDKGYEVVGIDDCSGGFKDYLDPRVKFYEFNLLNKDSLYFLFEIEQPDYVAHFAAYASEGLSDYIKNYNYQNNVVCSVNVINACINWDIKKLLFTSSMAVMGEGNPPFKEVGVPNPVDSYGIAKLAVEKELEISKKKFGLSYSILRPHNVISPIYQNYSDLYRNVLGIWCNQIINHKNITVYSDGSQKRAFSDVKFLLPAMEKLFYKFHGEIFNIGADNPITIFELAHLTKQISRVDFGYETNIDFLEARTEVKYAYSDHTKAKLLLGFEDKTNLKEVITKMIEWVQLQPKRETRRMSYEINKNMYSFWK